jgi:phosphatidylglycerol:prolipoprotein diacylglycerol transferase
MLPRLLSLDWGSVVFHLNGYGFAIFSGTLAALLVSLGRAKDAGLPVRPLLRVFMLAVAGLFAGAKLAYVLQYGVWSFPGGWVFYGGLIGGTAAAVAASRRFGLPVLPVAELGVPCALLAAAFGRLGCFFAGCCYGTVWDGGLRYPARSHAWKDQVRSGLIAADSPYSLPTVPAPLLESAALLAIFVAASLCGRRGARPGRVLATCGLLYSIWRLIAESWRGDHAPFCGPFTFSQGISVFVFIGAAALLFLKPSSGPRRSAGRPDGAPWGQVAAILLLVAVVTGGVGCSAKERRHTANEIGEKVIDESGDCMGDCIGDCTQACVDDCTKTNCHGGENGERTAAEPENKAPQFRLPPIEPGRNYTARLMIQGMLNQQEVSVLIAGDFQVREKDATGALPIDVQLAELELRFGPDRISSAAGTLEMRVDPKGRAVIRKATLSDEALSVLKAMEPLNSDFFTVESDSVPHQRWSDRLKRELEIPDPRGECQGEFRLGNERRPFKILAFITRAPGGERRVHWLLRH